MEKEENETQTEEEKKDEEVISLPMARPVHLLAEWAARCHETDCNFVGG